MAYPPLLGIKREQGSPRGREKEEKCLALDRPEEGGNPYESPGMGGLIHVSYLLLTRVNSIKGRVFRTKRPLSPRNLQAPLFFFC